MGLRGSGRRTQVCSLQKDGEPDQWTEDKWGDRMHRWEKGLGHWEARGKCNSLGGLENTTKSKTHVGFPNVYNVVCLNIPCSYLNIFFHITGEKGGCWPYPQIHSHATEHARFFCQNSGSEMSPFHTSVSLQRHGSPTADIEPAIWKDIESEACKWWWNAKLLK